MTTILVATKSIARDVVLAFGARLSMELVADHAARGSQRHRVVESARGRVLFFVDGLLAQSGIEIAGRDEAALVDEVKRDFGALDVDALLVRARDATAPVDRVRSLCALGVSLYGVKDARDDVIAVLRDRLLDAEQAVRWTAALAAAAVLWPDVDALLDDAARVHADLAPCVRRRASIRERLAKGTAHDLPSSDRLVLQRRAEDALAAGQIERALETANALLELDDIDQHAWAYRGLAHRKNNAPLRAFADLTTAIALGSRHHVDVAAWTTTRNEIGSELAANTALVDDATAHADIVADLWRLIARREDLVEVADAVLALPSSAPKKNAMFAGVAATKARAHYEEGQYQAAVDAIERALQHEDFACVALLHAFAARCARELDDVEAARASFAEAARRFDESAPMATSAKLVVDRWNARAFGKLSAAENLQEWAHVCYEIGELDEAVDVATRALALNEDALDAHQTRAVALTGLKRHDDAIAAYTDALSAIERVRSKGDSVFFGADARGVLLFNRACEHAFLGHSDDALRDLEAAIDVEGKWGKAAAADDYFASLHADPRFMALVSRGQGAAVEERAKSFELVRDAVERALDDLRMRNVPNDVVTAFQDAMNECVDAVLAAVTDDDEAAAEDALDDAMSRTRALAKSASLSPLDLDGFASAFVGLANRAGLRDLAGTIRDEWP